MKLLVAIAMLAFVSPVLAQRMNIDSARIYLAQDNYKKAMPFANEAVKNDKTKGDAEAWFLRGMVYLQLTLDEAAKSPNAIVEAYGSFLKTLTLKPDYGVEINSPLYSVAIVKFNRGGAFYTDKAYERAYNEFAEVAAIYKMGGGKRFANNKEFKGVQVDARKNAAYAANSAGHTGVAATLLEDLIKEESKNDSDVYHALIEIYDVTKNTSRELAIINAARAQFPDAQSFRLAEINYYIGNGIKDGLRQKLEEAVKRDPENIDLVFRLANTYIDLAYPADAQGKLLDAPANFAEIYGLAENTYNKAFQLAPANASISYNFGMLYYNRSRWYSQLITGNQNPDDKHVAELTAKGKDELAKALPHFEKCFSLLDAKAASLTDEEKPLYQNTMIALSQIYSRNGDADKKAQVDKVMEKTK